jgi:hypothetical protein
MSGIRFGTFFQYQPGAIQDQPKRAQIQTEIAGILNLHTKGVADQFKFDSLAPETFVVETKDDDHGTRLDTDLKAYFAQHPELQAEIKQ